MTDDPQHHCHPSLSDADFEMLQEFLFHNLEQRDCMPLDAAHGFISGVVSGPKNLTPEDWLPIVVGHGDFADEAQAEQVLQAVLQLYNDTLHDLEHGHYGPIVIHKPVDNDGEPLPLPYAWCQGYLQGLAMHGEETHQTMANDEDAANLMAPVVTFMMYEEEHLLDPPDEPAHRAAAAELGKSAVGLFQWWSDKRESPILLS